MNMNDISDVYCQLLKKSLPSGVMQEEEIYKTAKRAANSWDFQLNGYKQSLAEVVGDALYPAVNHELVVVQQIAFSSLCEHHLLPMVGFCHIAYLPKKSILGLSKFARIVEMFAHRLQLQERFTKEVSEAVQQVVDGEGVGVIARAQHFCMSARGVERREAMVTTSSRLGAMQKPEVWQQFVESLAADQHLW